MKKRIRKTGEIVDVISYSGLSCASSRRGFDCVSYIDSKGEEHFNVEGLNIYWDFEDVEETINTDIDWESRKYEIAKEAMLKMIDPKAKTQYYGIMAINAVEIAIHLIDKLKKVK